MDQVDKAKELQSKIGGVVDRLIDEMIPEFRPIIDQDPSSGILDDDQRYGVSGLNVATAVIAAVLTKLRGHGCTEEMLELVVTNAQERAAAEKSTVS